MPRARISTPRRTREQWQQLLAEHELSGLSRAAFARANGVSPRALQWWSWRLRGEGRSSRAVELVVREPRPELCVEIALGDLILRLHEASPADVAALVRELRLTC